MSDDPKRVIELEPRHQGPFRWPVFLAMVLVWFFVVLLAIELKSRVLEMIWPGVLFILVLYLAVCTFLLLRNRK